MHLVKWDWLFLLSLPVKPEFTVEEAEQHSKCMSCDCFTYHQTTWVCEHVLLARYRLHISDNQQGYSLMAAGSNLKPVNGVGRPTKKVDCLQNTSKRDEQNLLKAIMKKPSRLLGVRVVHKLVIDNLLVHYHGKVLGICPTTQAKNDFTYHVKMDDDTNEWWSVAEIMKNRLD